MFWSKGMYNVLQQKWSRFWVKRHWKNYDSADTNCNWSWGAHWLPLKFLCERLLRTTSVHDRWKHLVLNILQCTQLQIRRSAASKRKCRKYANQRSGGVFFLKETCCFTACLCIWETVFIIQVYFWKDVSEHMNKSFILKDTAALFTL